LILQDLRPLATQTYPAYILEKSSHDVIFD